jgi:hypothetical protein
MVDHTKTITRIIQCRQEGEGDQNEGGQKLVFKTISSNSGIPDETPAL